MNFDFAHDQGFVDIERDVSNKKGLLEDAWVSYEGEKWYPTIIKDRKTHVRGYEVNFTGKWGKNIDVNRQKLPLKDFLIGLADGTFPREAAVRCKRLTKSDKNGRDLSNLEMSVRMRELIARYRSNKSTPSVVSPNRQESRIISIIQNDEDEIEKSLLDDLDYIDTVSDDENGPTERLDNRMSRIGQGKFRKNTIATWGGQERCAVTGISVREVLTASHIIPWSEDVGQRKRGCNGILLAAHLDRLFDRHLIGFKQTAVGDVYSVVVAPRLADRFSNLAPLGLTADASLNLSKVRGPDRQGLDTNLRAHLDRVLNNK
ncbi:HNH endonuclease [Rhodoferax sp. U2-2l]|uniref:HNH endonuclease n=1 Tax=Rhodoferax sp. U2-2l TaxID=2884000 RepID=UPI001D0BA6A7|nr:HNH endonuclease [Rhodoferax sp. U2-2l]MCB8748918.1 HNH endonuclease [Rhodoferax sp. U2-2l]